MLAGDCKRTEARFSRWPQYGEPYLQHLSGQPLLTHVEGIRDCTSSASEIRGRLQLVTVARLGHYHVKVCDAVIAGGRRRIKQCRATRIHSQTERDFDTGDNFAC